MCRFATLKFGKKYYNINIPIVVESFVSTPASKGENVSEWHIINTQFVYVGNVNLHHRNILPRIVLCVSHV